MHRIHRKSLLNLDRLERRLLLSGATMYVDDDFTAATPGWGVDHFDEIQEGLDAADGGDTVMVAAGTYNENISLDSDLDGLTLQGAGALVTIIDGGGSDSVVEMDNFDGGTISGFTIRNGSAAEGGGINLDSSDSTITSCIITGNTAELNGGGIYVGGGSPTIINNVMTDNNSLFGGANYVNSASPIFANNTIYGNTAGSCGGALYSPGSVFTMSNCILWNNESSPLFPNDEIMLRSDSYLTIRHSIIMDGDDEIFAFLGADFSYNSTNSDSNPDFIAAGSGDFHLQPDSPAIDAADGDAAPATDFEGSPRFDDPLTTNDGAGTPDYADIGAFEFTDGASNEPPTITSLDISPGTVSRPDDVTLTAQGVDDPDGAGTVAAVEFYMDSNGNGTLETASDQLLGTDTSSDGGWNWTGSSGGWPAGASQTFFARARDNYSAYSDPVSTTGTVLNSAPTIDSMTDWLSSGNATLIAQDVSDDDAVASVAFYLDANGDGVFQAGTDTYLGDGSQDDANWWYAVDVSGWADDTYTFFARAQDSDSEWSNVASTEVVIGQRYMGRIDDPASDAYVDVYAREDLSLNNVQVTFTYGAVYYVKLTGSDSMYGLGLLLHSEGGTGIAASVKDGRSGSKADIAFIAADAPIKDIKLKSGITGHDLNGQTMGEFAFDTDMDGDGDTTDGTAVYLTRYARKIQVDGDALGDVLIGGTEPGTGVSLSQFKNKSEGYHGDLVTAGHVEKMKLAGGFGSRLDIGGSLGKLQIKNGHLGGTVEIAGRLDKVSVSGGSVTGDISVLGAGESVGSLKIKRGGFGGSLTTAGHVGKIKMDGSFGSELDIGGDLDKLKATGASFGGEVDVDGDLGKLKTKGADVRAEISIGGDLSKLQIKGGDFDGDLQVAGDLGKLDIKASSGGGGWFRAGANVTVGDLLKKVKMSAFETDNGGNAFGLYADDFAKLSLGEVSVGLEVLPYADGDFRVEYV